MESILPMNDELYPFRSHRTKSSPHMSTNPVLNKVTSTNQQTSPTNLTSVYQQMKATLAERSIYILGILNLALAGIAIVCVTHAEDHPEYFSLVYIAVSIFVFYMATILLIIALQIIETCQEQYRENEPSSSIPLSQTPSPPTPVPVLVESLPTMARPKTKVSRSQTMPLTSTSSKILINSTFDQYHHHHGMSTSTSSSTLRDFEQTNTSTHLALLPKFHQTIIALPKNYQSFASPTIVRCCPSWTNITNLDNSPQFSTLIKPIPITSLRGNKNNNKSTTRFADIDQ